MSELMKQATDDQIVLACCFAGVFVSGMVMYFSYYVGQWNAKSNCEGLPTIKTLPAPQTLAPVTAAQSAPRKKAA